MNYKLTNSRNDIYIYSFSSDRIMVFKSFLTDFADNYVANWSSQEIYGRMDPIYNYKNTVRKILLSFDVPSFSLLEAKENAEKADIFIKSLYPVYSIEPNQKGAATLASPPLFKIKLNNFIKNVSYTQKPAAEPDHPLVSGLLGYIDNFSFKPSLESGFLEETDSNLKEDKKLYPKLYKVNFNFFPIHEHPLGHVVNEQNIHIDRLVMDNSKKLPFPHEFDRQTEDTIQTNNADNKTKVQEALLSSTILESIS